MNDFDRWENLIKSIEPNIKELREILESGSIPVKLSIITISTKINDTGYLVCIEEDWGDSAIDLEFYSTKILDDRCKWAEDQLKTWPDVSRYSWQEWQFKYKHDAEKFRTLYNLMWGK